MFQEVRQSRVFQEVVAQVEEAILQGQLKAGSRLPAERELAEIFKASRGTLREALRVLEHKGLIDIKTGVKGGAVVKDLTTRPVSESLALLIRSQKASLRNLAEFREGVEGMVAAMAVERATKEDVRQLKHLLKQAKAHLDAGTEQWDAFIEVDNRIHRALARMARNPVYESVMQTVYDNIHRYFDRFLPRRGNILKENYQDLCDIVEAVEKGQASEARLLVQSHVYKFNRLMERRAWKERGRSKKGESAL